LHFVLSSVTTTEVNTYAESFSNSSKWFKGKEVDKLSKEEAQIIAKNTIEGYKRMILSNPLLKTISS